MMNLVFVIASKALKILMIVSFTSLSLWSSNQMIVEQLIQKLQPTIQTLLNNQKFKLQIKTYSGKLNAAIIRESQIGSPDYNYQTHEFKVNLFDDKASYLVTGATIPLQEIIVLKHPMQNGQIINVSDLTTIIMPMGAVQSNIITQMNEIINKTPTTKLSSNTPITNENVQVPQVIKKNANVRIVYRKPGLEISTNAVAQNNLQLGQSGLFKKNNGQNKSKDIMAVAIGINLALVGGNS